jgi:hypothetical protein
LDHRAEQRTLSAAFGVKVVRELTVRLPVGQVGVEVSRDSGRRLGLLRLRRLVQARPHEPVRAVVGGFLELVSTLSLQRLGRTEILVGRLRNLVTAGLGGCRPQA